MQAQRAFTARITTWDSAKSLRACKGGGKQEKVICGANY
jgi:hypothetical protein